MRRAIVNLIFYQAIMYFAFANSDFKVDEETGYIVMVSAT